MPDLIRLKCGDLEQNALGGIDVPKKEAQW